MVAYLLVTVGVTVFLARRGEPVVAAAAIGGVATLGMLFVLFRNVYPVPAAPYNILPWLFLTLLVLAAAWYAVIRSRVDADILEQDLIGVQQDLANESA